MPKRRRRLILKIGLQLSQFPKLGPGAVRRSQDPAWMGRWRRPDPVVEQLGRCVPALGTDLLWGLCMCCIHHVRDSCSGSALLLCTASKPTLILIIYMTRAHKKPYCAESTRVKLPSPTLEAKAVQRLIEPDIRSTFCGFTTITRRKREMVAEQV